MTQKRILLVDDDRVCLENLRQVLKEAGYEVMTATDGFQGLALARSWAPDLIVLELVLPGRDGFQICASLKSDPSYNQIPIIVLTSVYITPEDEEQGLQLGAERYLLKADAYIAKPLVYEQILHEIRLLLGEKTSYWASQESLVLVVDGDGTIHELLRQTLNGRGYTVVAAGDGEEGWIAFQSSAPSIVLVDVQAPGLEGLEVLERIRKQDRDVAVVMMAASGSKEAVVHAMERGADGYLVKPFEPWQIALAVEKNLEKARLRRLNQQLLARLRDSNARLMEKQRTLHSQNANLQDAFDGLQEAERMRRNLVSMVVHDLKNPLNVILIGLDLFATDFDGALNRDQWEILSNTKLASEQMLHLITNLLEVQRLEEDKMPVRLRPLDLVQPLGRAVRQVQPSAEKRSLSLRLDISPSLPLVLADGDLLSRIILNLLDNAIKFTPLNGEICITSEWAAGSEHVVVVVTDNGPGIPKSEQSRIFEKYAQVDHGLGRGKASVGLGLAFCRLAVEAQGGRIWVESGPGQGARFKFALPIWQEGSEAAEG
jgi:two-component system sensor histidine kinase/response regulator